jgi:zinc-ribbon domain
MRNAESVKCANCGSSVPAASRFCPECGRPLLAGPAETAAYGASGRRRWPPDPLLLLAVLILAGGIILFVGGRWAWGLVVLLLGALVFLSQREVERRAARATFAALRARFSAQREVFAARSRGQFDVFRARRELSDLEAERIRLYTDLGRAVFEEDGTGMEAGKKAVGDVAGRIQEKEAEIETLIEQMDARVRQVQAGVAPTEKLESPPEPARIPEPWPPPDEGDPPAPAQVPEPSPGDPAPEPEHPPTPQERQG